MNQLGMQRILMANGAFSSLSGGTLIAAPSWFDRLFENANETVFMIMGGCLLIFGADILFHARRPKFSKGRVLLYIAGDAAWVVVSMILLAGGWVEADLAQILVWGVGAVVLIFTVLETACLMAPEREVSS